MELYLISNITLKWGKIPSVKIAIFSTYRLGDETGAGKVSEELAKKLSENNQVLFVCLGEKYKKEKPKRGLTFLKIPSVFVGKAYAPILTPKPVNNLYKDLDNFSPQIIHSQNIVFASLTGLLWAKKNNVPFVLTFHFLPSEGSRWIFPKMKGKKVLKTINYVLSGAFVKKFVNEVNLIITLNSAVENSLRKLKIKTKTKRIPNGLILEHFHKLKIKKPSKRKRFVFFGSYFPRKNQAYLIRVFSYLPKNYQLTLYGNKKTGKNYYEKLVKLKEKLSCNNVSMRDFVSRSEVAKILERSDYSVSASTKEVQSLVIIESLASGTPIIGLKNETIEEMINPKIGLSFNQKTDPETFAQNLKKYVENNSEIYEKIAQRCKERSKKYDIKTTSKKITRTYKYLIKNRPKQKQAFLVKIVPDQFKQLFSQILPKPTPKTLTLRVILFFTILISTVILSPVKLVVFILKKIKILKEVIK